MLHWVLVVAMAADAPVVDAPLSHTELVTIARRAEQRGDLRSAFDACTAALEADPAGPGARRCRSRLAWMATRRDPDGSWHSWTELEGLRALMSPADAAAQRAAIQGLTAREEASATVRAEAALWLTADALKRDDPQAAVDHTDPWAGATELPEVTATRLVQLRAVALARLGRDDEADAAQARVAVPVLQGRPTPVDQVRRDARRTATQRAAMGGLAAHALVSLPPWLRRRPRVRPWGALLVLALCGATWVLAEGWAEGAGDAVPAMAAGLVAVYLSTLSALDPDAPWPAAYRGLVRLTAAVASMSVFYMALYASHTLDWVGL